MESTALLSIILVIFLFLVLAYKLLTPPARLKRYGDKIPGPKPYPILGNSILFTSKPLLPVILNLSEAYGSVCRVWIGKALFILINDPEDIRVILSSTKNLNKTGNRFLRPWIGDTDLILSNGDKWHARRKLLAPSFHYIVMEDSLPIMVKNAQILCEKLQNRSDRGEFEISLYIEKCSLDTMSEVAMGINLQTQCSENREFLQSLKIITAITIKRMYSPWLHPSFIFNLSKDGRTYYENLSVVHTEGRKVINQRKRMLEENNEIHSKPAVDGKKYLAFLDFLLTESNFSDQELENEVHSFMFAGHDTSTATMSFCLYELSRNQNVQDKLIEEIKDILLNKQGQLTKRDFNNMEYLSCVIKETMRIYTIVPLLARKITEEIKLPSGYVMPLGSSVCMNIFSMHRNEKHYENPLEFIPERFQQSDDSRNQFLFLPFSAGHRNCIGQKFARMEMKVILSMILWKYQILPASDTGPRILDNSIVLRSLNGLPIKITSRDMGGVWPF